ncbi:hypothetical protein [Streptomyces microflavus]|uniref:hypothetical protein n=1 Tax=Streptomyces microflavus TaxID=1919 RepID=UPI002E32B542|nr:hypothetical protein [Streptomyces microflavus]
MAAGAAPYRKLDPALRAERAAIVFDLRLQGLSYRQIDVLTQAPDGPTGGHRISATSAKELLYEEVERRVDPRVDAWRALQLDRLDGVLRDHLALRNANWDRAMDGEERPALAVDRALNGVTKTVEAQNKLLGLATTKIEAQVVEVTQQDVELQEMIRTAKAKAALEEAAIIDGEAGE